MLIFQSTPTKQNKIVCNLMHCMANWADISVQPKKKSTYTLPEDDVGTGAKTKLADSHSL